VTTGGNNIVVKYNDNSTTNPLNYKIVMEYRVTPRALVFTANNQTKTYDGAAYTGGNGYTTSGLTNGNVLTSVVDIHQVSFGQLASPTDASGTPIKNAEGALHAGSYSIGMAGSNVQLKNPDYYVKYVDGTLTVNKRAITVKPDDVTHVYGDLPNSLSGGLAAGSTLAAGDTLTGLVVHNNGQRDVQRNPSGNVTAQTGVLTATGAHVKNAAGEDVSKLSLQQLRGREGARVRRLYREHSQRTGVPWDRREYDPDDFDDGSVVNQALSAANSAIYGVVHAVIVALGCSPGLGFVHNGTYRSFVYDIADLYKANLTIPIAFDVAASPTDEAVGTAARKAVRDAVREFQLLERCVADIKQLLSVSGALAIEDDDDLIVDDLRLWDDHEGTVAAGVSYEESDSW